MSLQSSASQRSSGGNVMVQLAIPQLRSSGYYVFPRFRFRNPALGLCLPEVPLPQL